MSLEEEIKGYKTVEESNVKRIKVYSEYTVMYDPERVLATGYKNKGSNMSRVLSERLGELNYQVKILENVPLIIYKIPVEEETIFRTKLEEIKSEGIISSYERSGDVYALETITEETKKDTEF